MLLRLTILDIVYTWSLCIFFFCKFDSRRIDANKNNFTFFDRPIVDQCDESSVQVMEEDLKMLKSTQNASILPQVYKLFYKFHDTLLRYDGIVFIDLLSLNSSDHLTLQSSSHEISSIKILSIDDSVSNVAQARINSVCRKKDNIFLKFSKFLESLERVTLIIEFNGTTSDGMSGIYKSKYSNNAEGVKNEEIIVSTHFEPEQARSAFPCLDYPKFKTYFKLTLEYPAEYNAISNMPALKTIHEQTKTTLFDVTPIMSTYLFAFTISKYEYIETATIDNIKVRVFLPKYLLDDGRYALDIASKVLPMYEELFHIKYSLPKVDLIGIPNFQAGAMENWGLITFRMNYLLYNPKKTSLFMQQQVAETVFHECAHQWFGNLVTMNWWNDIWLNEGFATYMQSYIATKVFPDWNMTAQLSSNTIQSAMHYDELITSHPISLPLDQVVEPGDIFDSTSYLKSSSIIWMIYGTLGETKFNKQIEKYLSYYSYGVSTSYELWDMLSEASNDDVKLSKMMKTWIFKAGFPYINIFRKDDTFSFVITQQRFVVSRNFQSDEPSTWWIPLNYIVKYSGESQLSTGFYWLNQSTGLIVFNKNVDWIKLNHKATGFYRVLYTEKMFDALSDTLTEDNKLLGEIDILNLLQDTFSFLAKKFTSIAQVFELLNRVKYSKDYFIVSEIIAVYESIGEAIKYDTELYLAYKEKISPKVAYIYGNIMNVTDSLSHLSLRYQKLMKYMLTSACVKFDCFFLPKLILKKYETWSLHDDSTSPEEREIMLATVGIYGHKEQWDSLISMYIKETDPSFKDILLDVLPNINSTDYLNVLLLFSLNDNIVSTQDSAYLIGSICQKSIMKNLGWEFVKKNWKIISKMYSDDKTMLSHLVKSLRRRVTSEQELQEYIDFFTPKKGQFYAKELEEAIEASKNHIDWLNFNIPGIREYIKKI